MLDETLKPGVELYHKRLNGAESQSKKNKQTLGTFLMRAKDKTIKYCR